MNTIQNSIMGISPIDRHAQIRHNTKALAEIASSPQSKYLIWVNDKILIANNNDSFFSYSQICDFITEQSELIYLGKEQKSHYFSYQLSTLPNGFNESELHSLRSIALLASHSEANLYFHSQGLFNWHKSHQFCANCGHKTHLTLAGHSRKCTNAQCGREHYPRTDPAVIFSVSNNQTPEPEFLLARQASWDENRYSVLAGFVEPGESLENAVFREAYEEVGIDLHTTRYVASQPWPFPASIMVGFEAVTKTSEITLIDKEIEHAMWLNAKEITNQLLSGELKLPYSVSISWHLINRWYQSQTGNSLSTIQQTQ